VGRSSDASFCLTKSARSFIGDSFLVIGELDQNRGANHDINLARFQLPLLQHFDSAQ
jgi:hypothetical protein